jgi:thioester reductase-like protein
MPLDDLPRPTDGYGQSKWVAEKLVLNAGARGIPVSIYRLDQVGGDRRTGAGDPNAFIWRLIKGCLQLGCAPYLDATVSMASVDFVSQALVCLVRQPDASGKVFHVVAPRPMHWNLVVEVLRDDLGFPLERLPYNDWRARLIASASAGQDNVLHPLVGLLPASQEDEHARSSDDTEIVHFDDANTARGLAGTSIACPPLDATLLKTYVAYLVRTGFLEAGHAVGDPLEV